MVQKFFAYYKSGSEMKQINVYQALKLQNSRINNKDDIIEFWDTDSKDAEKVHPNRTGYDGRAAHFSFFPGSTHVGVYNEMTMSHRVYQSAYAESPKMLLDAFGDQVMVFIKKSQKEYYFKTSYNAYQIDILLDLERTEPASFFYKWNGMLALEVNVTHGNEKSKTNDLTENGVQIFQVKIYDNQTIPEDITGEQFENYKQSIKKKVEKFNYKVIGKYLNEVLPKTGSVMEKRYLILADFESEKKKLEEQTKSLENRIKSQQECISGNEGEIRAIEEEIQKRKASLNLWEEKNKQMKLKLVENEDILNAAERALQHNSELISQHSNDQKTIFQLQSDLEKEKNKGLLKRIFNR